MSSFKILAATTAAAALLAVPALALADPSDSAPGQAPAAADQQPAPAADPSMAPSAGANAVMSSSTTTDQNGAAVTNTLVTNGPIPDTAANRAKYGSPMSNAGKKTAPAGN